MVGIFWEISVTRVIVFLLSVVTFYMVSRVVYWVFIVINSSVLIKIIVTYIAHWVVKVEQTWIHTLVSPL